MFSFYSLVPFLLKVSLAGLQVCLHLMLLGYIRDNLICHLICSFNLIVYSLVYQLEDSDMHFYSRNNHLALYDCLLLKFPFHCADKWVYHAKPLSTYFRHVGCFYSYFRISWKGLTIFTLIKFNNRYVKIMLKASALHLKYANPLQVDWMYYLAFSAVAVGLVIYSGYPSSWTVFIHLGVLQGRKVHLNSSLVLRGEKEENKTSTEIAESSYLQCKGRDEEAGTDYSIKGSMVGCQRKGQGKHQDSPPLLRFLFQNEDGIENDVLASKLNDDVLCFLVGGKGPYHVLISDEQWQKNCWCKSMTQKNASLQGKKGFIISSPPKQRGYSCWPPAGTIKHDT